MTRRTLEKCQITENDQVSHAKNLIAELRVDEISARGQKWEYRMPSDIVKINNRMSKDLSLFYTVDDVRKLFNWKRPMYHNICKLVSQQYVGFSSLAVKSKLNLLIHMQAVLTQLDTFNLLTEDATSRKLLYEVCKATEFPHQAGKKHTMQLAPTGG